MILPICVGNQSVPPKNEVINEFSNQTENTTTQRLEKFLALLFPEQWRIDNPNLIQEIPRSTEISPIKTLDLQMEAITSWEGTCKRLKKHNELNDGLGWN